MNTTLDPYIIELESKIQILERENETLSAKAEENLLLNRAFKEINDYEDIDNLLTNTLESTSVLLNIQFSGIFDLNHSQFVCKNSYALFSNDDTTSILFDTSEDIRKRIVSHETCYLDKEFDLFVFNYPSPSFVADKAVIVPLNSEIIKNRFFIFIDDKSGQDLVGRIPILKKIIQIIAAKLERIYYQNELRKLNEELEKKVESRTIELLNQNIEYARLNEELLISKEKAEESDRLKTAFLQNMSHEIRTPMNAIMGFSSLLVQNYDNRAKLEKFSEIINQRCSDLLNIINEILDIAKIESGQLPIKIEECNIVELFSELNSFFKEHQQRIGKQHLNFSIKCSCGQSYSLFMVDKVKLKQILINLIGNAFKFTDQGSIECGCTLENDLLIFHVVDTGIGIPLEKQEQIFERFMQLRQMASKNVGGTGLGLSIAKALTGLLGGNMWLDSKPEKGTTFYFSIPFKKSQLTHNETIDIESPHELYFHDKTILIVEDDIYNAEYLKEILSLVGFNIVTAECGTDAIQAASIQHFDLVLMDIRLPDMSGYEATKMIRQIKPQLQIIAQTAYAAQDEKQKAIEAGCVDYISKPINRDLLFTMIKTNMTATTN